MRISTLFLVSCIFSSGVLASSKKLVRRHSGLISRFPHPQPAPAVVDHPVAKRNLSKRCATRKVSSQASASTGVAAAPVNVAPSPTVKPPTSSSTKVNPPASSSQKPSSSSAPPPASSSKKPSSSAAPPPPPPTTSSTKPSTSSVHHSATPTPKPSPSPSPSPAPSSPASSSSGSGSPFSGTQTNADFTFYGTGLGACGITNNDNDMIAALSKDLFDNYPGATANPNNNPVCGKKIKLTYQGHTTIVTVTDRCVACALTDVDLSPAGFLNLAPLAVGRLFGGTWDWCADTEC